MAATTDSTASVWSWSYLGDQLATALLNPIRAFRPRYLPLLMVYFAYGALGLIAAAQVEILSGRVPAPPPTTRGPSPARDRSPFEPAVPLETFGFGMIGYGSWLARDTFQAVLGNSQAPMLGAGLHLREGDFFLEASVERFEKTGTRVFVADGHVFTLGISDTVRIIPIALTVGYRRAGRYVAPYAGGGVGTYLYKETSDFAESADDVSDHFTSYHVLGGVELLSRAIVHAAFELQFTTVPNALGASGASAAFNEHNLGGIRGRVKILVGR